eukprot:SAG11_NODE_7759_length_1100_cov_1.031968_2_plen_130_part_00
MQVEEEQCTGETDGYVHNRREVVDYFAILPGLGGHANGDAASIQAHPLTESSDASANHAKAGETGHVALNADWVTVSLKSYYFRPVVIAGTPTDSREVNNGRPSDPVVVRIRNLRHGNGCAGWCFDIRL